MTEKAHDLKTLSELIDTMPLYGKLREVDIRLTFGQYLVVLKEWFVSLQDEVEGVKRVLRELPVSAKIEFGTMTVEEVIRYVSGE